MRFMAEAGSPGVRQRFVEFLTHKHLRLTAQRQAIVETVFNTRQHFTAEQLLAWSRQRDRSVSRATVYRTLPLLIESGLVQEIDFGKDFKYYDPNFAERPHHNHIICQDCQQIIEFESDKLDQVEEEIRDRLGFRVESRRFQVTARCEELRKSGSCKKRAE